MVKHRIMGDGDRGKRVSLTLNTLCT